MWDATNGIVFQSPGVNARAGEKARMENRCFDIADANAA
jgi:hypothetical protein